MCLYRYVICRGLKAGIEEVRDYLFTVNIKINQLRNSEQDVNLVVPLEVIRGDHDFYDYMIHSNKRWVNTLRGKKNLSAGKNKGFVCTVALFLPVILPSIFAV